MRGKACLLACLVTLFVCVQATHRWAVLIRGAVEMEEIEALERHNSQAVAKDAYVPKGRAHSLWEFEAETEQDVMRALSNAGLDKTRGQKDIIIAPVQPVEKEISWGLDRIDSRPRVYDNVFSPRSGLTGVGSTVYVVDTGIQADHPDFQGRASTGFAFYSPSSDCDGHGTHVASTAVGGEFGVAKGADVIAVKVLDCSGSGTTFSVAEGLLWILDNFRLPGVINLSLGYYGFNTIIDILLRDCIESGLVVVAAAGNGDRDSCAHNPSSTSGVISVAATEENNDQRASFSNYGSCVDVFAPGVSILGARLGGGSVRFSGTSMATPHVAGVVALLQQSGDPNPASIILATATQNVVKDLLGSPDRLLYVGSTLAPQPSPLPGSGETTSSSSSSTTTGQACQVSAIASMIIVCSLLAL